jgi:hypothetical protein
LVDVQDHADAALDQAGRAGVAAQQGVVVAVGEPPLDWLLARLFAVEPEGQKCLRVAGPDVVRHGSARIP